MAAGGYKEFVAGETLDQDEINDYLMQGVLVFAGTAARGSAIGTPVEGQFSFRTDDDVLEFFDGSDWVEVSTTLEFNFLVIGGGGGGGAGGGTTGRGGGGGGAGGYRCSVTGENSGGGLGAEPFLPLVSGSFTVTVGAGGAGGTNQGSNGVPSRLYGVVGYGGGGGGGANTLAAGLAGASGGGAGDAGTTGAKTGGSPLLGQGFKGGDNPGAVPGIGGAGGGGAGSAGVDQTSSTTGTNGGAGVASSITGSSVTRAAGGVGANSTTPTTGTAGSANTGDGGGGATNPSGSGATGGNGGSGVVIISYPSSITLTIGAGLTSSTTTVGANKVTTFTAGTDTVSF